MYRYVVLGAGMQGTACAYDLAKFGDAKEVIIADIDKTKANTSSKKINHLLKTNTTKPAEVNAANYKELVSLIEGANSIISATSYRFHVNATRAAIAAGANMCDLGGNTEVVLTQHKLSNKAKEARVAVVPDCGLMPGMGNTLAAYGIARLDKCHTINIRCGGLPQNPKPPLSYKLVFSVEGLTNEYFGEAVVLRNGKIKKIKTFMELEKIKFPKPVGECEAFTTSGGTSTAPWSFKNIVKNYDYKTVRYQGHYDKIKTMLDMGFLDLTPLKINGYSVVPRDVFHALAVPKLTFPADKDLIVLRVICKGVKNDKSRIIQLDILDFHDSKTGFSAMERTTAFPASIVAIMLAKNMAPKGVVSLETGIEPFYFVKELKKRKIALKENIV